MLDVCSFGSGIFIKKIVLMHGIASDVRMPKEWVQLFQLRSANDKLAENTAQISYLSPSNILLESRIFFVFKQ